ncbi:MAG TPA: DUF1559 domain-containing protein, partial [Urbifossiella sp.]
MLSITRWLLGPLAVSAALAAVLAIPPLSDVRAMAEPVVAEAPAGADLALVPADAVGFVHIRLADLWKNEMLSGIRKTWERAGDKALAALDQQFVPAPSTIDRATAFVVLDEATKQPQVFGIASFSRPFAPDKVAASYLPDAAKTTVAGKDVYTDARRGVAITFPDKRNILIGMPGALEAYLGRKITHDGPIAAAIKLTETKPIVAAVNISALPIPPGALDSVPEKIRPALRAEQLLISLDFAESAKIEIKAAYKDAAAAGEAETAVHGLIKLGRDQLAKQKKEIEDKLFDPKAKLPRPSEELPETLAGVFALGAMSRIDDLLADPKLIVRDGKDLAFTAAVPKEIVIGPIAVSAIGLGLLLPAVQKVRAAASRVSSANNLKQIGLAIHNYHDANGHFPTDITDKNGKPLLSWRVAILPYIEQQNIYQKFKMDEPWDSENNATWSKMAIKTFLSPSSPTPHDKDGYGLTNYLGVKGPGAAFEPGKKLKFTDFTDGTSNTVMVVESSAAIPWAKPGDYPFDPKKPLAKLEGPGTPGLCQMLLADGSVRVVNMKTVSEKTLKAAFTRNGNEVL